MARIIEYTKNQEHEIAREFLPLHELYRELELELRTYFHYDDAKNSARRQLIKQRIAQVRRTSLAIEKRWPFLYKQPSKGIFNPDIFRDIREANAHRLLLELERLLDLQKDAAFKRYKQGSIFETSSPERSLDMLRNTISLIVRQTS